jgi:Domain of unknown function (DUF4389)
MSAYYTAPGLSATGQQAPAPVLVGFAGPAPQARLTVLFRLFMVIPHLIVLWLLGIAAEIVAVIGWFGALFTGQLPGFAAEFLTGYLRWYVRVIGYAIMLTDVYPPFTLDEADYPVQIAVAPGPLNRLAVLFRLFLLIPCAILQAIVAYGAYTVMGFVTWLIVLVKGEMPAALHQALAAVLRFQARTLGYALMLTSAYPAGLFGDPEMPGPWSPAGPYQGYATQPGYGAQPGYGTETYGAPQAGGAPVSWRLVLSGAARALMVTFIGLGVLIGVAVVAVEAATTSNTVTTVNAETRLQADVIPVRNAINNYSTRVSACKGALSCVTKLDRGVAVTLNTFAGKLRAIQMPSGQATTGAASLASTVSHTASLFAKLGAATSPSQYIKLAGSSGLQQSVDQLNQEYLFLGGILAH